MASRFFEPGRRDQNRRRLERLIRAPVLAAASLCALLWLGAAPASAYVNCTFNSPTMSFGSVGTTQTAGVSSSTTITYSCTNPLGQKVFETLCFGLGLTPMTSGANTLNWSAYQDAAHTIGFNNSYGGGGPEKIIKLTFNANQSLNGSLTLYGAINAGQTTLPAGTYTDVQAFNSTYTDHNESTVSAQATCVQATSPTRWATTVNATLTTLCAVSALAVDFLSQGLLSVKIDAVSTLSVTCSNGSPYSIALSLGTGTGVTLPTARKMTKGAETVTYGLYSDSARSVAWGIGAGQTVSGTGNGLTQSISIYGRVPPQATPSPGAYADTIVVTLTY